MTLSSFYEKNMRLIIEQSIKDNLTEEAFVLLNLMDFSRENRYLILDIQKNQNGTYVEYQELTFNHKVMNLITTRSKEGLEHELKVAKPGYDEYYVYSAEDQLHTYYLVKDLYENKISVEVHPDFKKLKDAIIIKEEQFMQNLLNGKIIMAV